MKSQGKAERPLGTQGWLVLTSLPLSSGDIDGPAESPCLPLLLMPRCHCCCVASPAWSDRGYWVLADQERPVTLGRSLTPGVNVERSTGGSSVFQAPGKACVRIGEPFRPPVCEPAALGQGGAARQQAHSSPAASESLP